MRVAVAESNVESTDSVANALLKEADVRGLRGRKQGWSIAELRLGTQGYDHLLSWLAHLDGDRARRDRESTAQGFVLLALAAEAARRLVGVGEVWPALAQLPMQAATRTVLFGRSASPHSYVRDSISKAATRLGLRSALSAGQPWYATVVLQFGLSRRGIETMLGRWLTQGLPDSVASLLHGRQHSVDFEHTWAAIRQLGDPSQADDARTQLLASPWVLPEWLDDIAAVARAVAFAPTRAAALDESAASVLDGACLLWTDATPQLSLRLRALSLDEVARYELGEKRYDVIVDGEPRARLFKEEGTLVPTLDEICNLPPTASLAISLVDREGNVAHTEDLEVWCEDRPAEAFDREGRRVAPPLARAPRTLVYERDGALDSAAVTHTTPFGSRVATALGEVAREVTIRWPDGSSWTAARTIRPTPLRADPLGPAVLGETIRLRVPARVAEVIHPPGWRVDPDGTLVGSLPINATPTFRGRLRGDDGRIVAFEASLPLEGAALRRHGDWSLVPDEVEARELTELAWRVYSPTMLRGEALIVAGARPIARWSALGGARRIPGRLLGHGEALGWIDRTNLLAQDAVPAPIASAVIDHGELIDAGLDGDATVLRWRVDLDPEGMSLVAWTYGGLERVPLDAIAPGKEWRVRTKDEPLALCVAYHGARIGAWWAPSWSELLELVDTSSLAEQLALFLRVAALPILSPSAAPACRAFAARWPVEVARVWWLDEASPTSEDDVTRVLSDMAERAATRADEWRAVQRELFLDEAFSAEASEDVLNVFGSRGDGTCYVPTALVRTAALGLPWARPFFEGQREDLERHHAKYPRNSLLELSRRELLGSDDSFASHRSRAAFEKDLARQLGVSRDHLRALVEDQSTPVPFAKRVALASREFALASALHALRL